MHMCIQVFYIIPYCSHMSKHQYSNSSYYLACNVRYYRTKRALSLRELALVSGVNFTRLWSIEQGRDNPTLSTLDKIASALDVSLECLVRNPNKLEN